jgi:hypothetical protein
VPQTPPPAELLYLVVARPPLDDLLGFAARVPSGAPDSSTARPHSLQEAATGSNRQCGISQRPGDAIPARFRQGRFASSGDTPDGHCVRGRCDNRHYPGSSGRACAAAGIASPDTEKKLAKLERQAASLEKKYRGSLELLRGTRRSAARATAENKRRRAELDAARSEIRSMAAGSCMSGGGDPVQSMLATDGRSVRGAVIIEYLARNNNRRIEDITALAAAAERSRRTAAPAHLRHAQPWLAADGGPGRRHRQPLRPPACLGLLIKSPGRSSLNFTWQGLANPDTVSYLP